MVADVVFQLKCARVEEGTWEWWLLGCWMWPGAADVVAAVTIGGIVGLSAWALRKQGQR